MRILLLFAISNLKQTQAPKCPGYCMVNLLQAFCQAPAVPIGKTSSCEKGSFCCDNTRLVATQRPRPRPTPPPPTTPPYVHTTTQQPDYREECPGSCIVPLLSFTCFR